MLYPDGSSHKIFLKSEFRYRAAISLEYSSINRNDSYILIAVWSVAIKFVRHIESNGNEKRSILSANIEIKVCVKWSLTRGSFMSQTIACEQALLFG